jgi:NitT/TauT family transport system substrate-binding protein
VKSPLAKSLKTRADLRWSSVVAALFVLTLCASVHAQDQRKVRLAYSAFSVSFLNLFVARDAGLFKKHGLEPELIQMAGPLPVAALASGEIDYLTGYTTGIIATGRARRSRGS